LKKNKALRLEDYALAKQLKQTADRVREKVLYLGSTVMMEFHLNEPETLKVMLDEEPDYFLNEEGDAGVEFRDSSSVK
jgi:hypothetical protein